MSAEDVQRIDKWLWAARFYKTRKLSAQAISGGKVHLNGERVKPSRSIKAGDQLTITRDQYEYVITILAINDQRRPAKEAQCLYQESPQSIEKRQALSKSIKMLNAQLPYTVKKPDKKQRRQIVRFKRDV